MKATPALFEIQDHVIPAPRRSIAHPLVEASEEDLTGLAGVVLWGELLDRLGLVAEADRRQLRPIGPGGYAGGECYRAVVETQLAGGDFISDVSLLKGEATRALRGDHALPSNITLWRFLSGADLGRAMRAQAVNSTMLRRAWQMGAGPGEGLITIDPDATYLDTYGKKKEGSSFSYKGEVQMSPLVGVIGETGDVLCIRARGGKASPRRRLASFIDECVAQVPRRWREKRQLWVRIDSAGYSAEVIEVCVHNNAAFSITCVQDKRVKAAIYDLATNAATAWAPARDADGELTGSEVAETIYSFAGRDLRLIVRRQRRRAGEQLCFDDLDGWRFHAIVSNVPPIFADAISIEHHHRMRGGVPEDAIRQLKEDFGLNHAPAQNFFGNWCWWLAAALAHNVARWVRVLALPESFRTCRGKRLRLCFLNVVARVTRSGRRLHLRLARSYAHADAFMAALSRLRTLPAFA